MPYTLEGMQKYYEENKQDYLAPVLFDAIERIIQLEAEIALKADYIKRLENSSAVLIKRLWDYEHQASDERIRDEK